MRYGRQMAVMAAAVTPLTEAPQTEVIVPIDEETVPLTAVPELPETNLVPETVEEEEMPLAELPKTGDEGNKTDVLAIVALALWIGYTKLYRKNEVMLK